ncbi:MAG: hypothetical protein HKN49_10020 [Gammaproteobacteria bacterium]|nr:hypothetical protein [Gammaproteobacteria bacterium]
MTKWLATIALVLLVSACADKTATVIDEPEDLRALHAEYLNRQPVVADLPEELRAVAEACQAGDDQFLCEWGRKNLSSEDWDRIRSAEAEQERRKAEMIAMFEVCKIGDEAKLQSMYPGRYAFYEKVVSPPAFEERPVDAVVVFGFTGGPLKRWAKKVIEAGMAREGIDVPYGGPTAREYHPNKYAARNNTENFFYGYFTPEIEARMEQPRTHRDRLPNSVFTQSARNRDISVTVARDWLRARGHTSARILMTGQSSWPEYALHFDRYLSEFDISIDPNFRYKVRRDTSFLQAMCAPQRSAKHMWLDYEFYVNTLFPEG